MWRDRRFEREIFQELVRFKLSMNDLALPSSLARGELLDCVLIAHWDLPVQVESSSRCSKLRIQDLE